MIWDKKWWLFCLFCWYWGIVSHPCLNLFFIITALYVFHAMIWDEKWWLICLLVFFCCCCCFFNFFICEIIGHFCLNLLLIITVVQWAIHIQWIVIRMNEWMNEYNFYFISIVIYTDFNRTYQDCFPLKDVSIQ